MTEPFRFENLGENEDKAIATSQNGREPTLGPGSTPEDVGSTHYSKDQRWLARFMKGTNKQAIFFVILTFLLLFLSITAMLVYLLWFRWIPPIASWAFIQNDFSAVGVGIWSAVKYILGSVGICLCALIPVIFFIAIISQYFPVLFSELPVISDEYIARKWKLDEEKAKEYENTIKKDADNLIMWVNYSRIELEQYYRIGLQQGTKSYKSSLIAMWTGFAIMIIGILLFFLPSLNLPIKISPNSNIQLLTIASGVIFELVAGLFLWVYQSSKNQLTYFYNRQVYIHNALFAYKISNTIQNGASSDLSKQHIIEKILEFGILSSPIKETPLPSAKRASTKVVSRSKTIDA